MHAEACGDAGNAATYGAEGLEAQALVAQLGACGAGVHAAHGHDGHAEHELGHGVGVLARGVLHDYAVGGGCGKVDVVVACACAHHDFEARRGIENGCVDTVGAHDEGVGVGHGCVELCGRGVFLKQGHLVAGCFEHFADAGCGGCREGLFGGYQDFHLWVASKSFIASTRASTLSMGRAL